jgi:fructoselysine-6-P-deglycase FrlB-like protein
MTTWHDESFPELRSAPPWVMEDMVDAEAGLASAIAGSAAAAAAIAQAIRQAHEHGERVVVTGCGTSEHAAQGIAALVDDALGRPSAQARQALEAASDPWPGLCIGVSHEGETAATVAALAAARAAGAATALVTAGAGRAAAAADTALATPLADRSWCHTVGYVSPLLAGGLIAAALADVPFHGGALDRFLAELRATPVDATSLARAERLIAAGADADAVTARELALKVAEGARLPTAAYGLENVLHGHLVGHDAASALVVVATGPAAATSSRRAPQVLAAAGRIGIATAVIASREAAPALDSDLELVVDVPADTPQVLGRLLAGALALQLLTIAIVHARGVNPDLLRREEEAYREAAVLGEKKTARVFAPGA